MAGKRRAPAIEVLLAEAAKHEGVLTRAQARALRFPDATFSRAVRRHGWRRLHPGVYALINGDEAKQRLVAALTWAGPEAVVSHRAAAMLHGLEGVEFNLAELTLPESQHMESAQKDVVVHRSSALGKAYVVNVAGVRCTSVARTLMDLAAVVDEATLQQAVESAWRKNDLLLRWLASVFKKLTPQGRKGMATLHRLLRDCARRKHPLESVAEVTLWRGFPRFGLRRPKPGVPFRHPDAKGRIDFLYVKELVAVEFDGRETHDSNDLNESNKQFDRDRLRWSVMAALGIRVIVITHAHLKEAEGDVFGRIAEATAFGRARRKRPALAAVRFIEPKAVA